MPPTIPTPVEAVQPPFVSREDAARILGIGQTLLKELIRDGALEHVRQRRRVLIPVDALVAYAAAVPRQRGQNGNGKTSTPARARAGPSPAEDPASASSSRTRRCASG
jgi:excisionase family DNA binding protein